LVFTFCFSDFPGSAPGRGKRRALKTLAYSLSSPLRFSRSFNLQAHGFLFSPFLPSHCLLRRGVGKKDASSRTQCPPLFFCSAIFPPAGSAPPRTKEFLSLVYKNRLYLLVPFVRSVLCLFSSPLPFFMFILGPCLRHRRVSFTFSF